MIGSENPILEYRYAEKFVERFEVAGAQMILVGINHVVETRQAKGGTRRVQAKGTTAWALEARFMPQE